MIIASHANPHGAHYVEQNGQIRANEGRALPALPWGPPGNALAGIVAGRPTEVRGYDVPLARLKGSDKVKVFD
jgi:hypothetical protein